MHIRLKEDQGIGKELLAWWGEREDDKGGRAALRRASSVLGVTLTPAYGRLYKRLLAADHLGWLDAAHSYRLDRLAIVAGLLAHVKAADTLRLPVCMSKKPNEGDRPKVSELRFRRLLESPTDEDLFAGLRRALPLIDHQADIIGLAEDVLNWGDRVKKEWVYAYDWEAGR